MEDKITLYMKKGGKLFSPISLQEVRDATHYFFKCSGGNEFYINKHDYRIFDKNKVLIEDSLTLNYVKERLQTFITRREEELIRQRNFINKIHGEEFYKF